MTAGIKNRHNAFILATTFSINFSPSCPPLPPSVSDSSNHQPRAQIHRPPAGTKACNMQQQIDTAAVASYPPSAAQPWLGERTCFCCALACVAVGDSLMNYIDACILLKVSQAMYIQAAVTEGQGHGGSRCSQTFMFTRVDRPRRHAYAPPRSNAISLNSAQKNNHRKGQQSPNAANGKDYGEPRNPQYEFCSHTPAFSACRSQLSSSSVPHRMKFLRGKMR